MRGGFRFQELGAQRPTSALESCHLVTLQPRAALWKPLFLSSFSLASEKAAVGGGAEAYLEVLIIMATSSYQNGAAEQLKQRTELIVGNRHYHHHTAALSETPLIQYQ